MTIVFKVTIIKEFTCNVKADGFEIIHEQVERELERMSELGWDIDEIQDETN